MSLDLYHSLGVETADRLSGIADIRMGECISTGPNRMLTSWTSDAPRSLGAAENADGFLAGLTEDELEEFLAAAALEDVNGLSPLHQEWTPT